MVYQLVALLGGGLLRVAFTKGGIRSPTGFALGGDVELGAQICDLQSANEFPRQLFGRQRPNPKEK